MLGTALACLYSLPSIVGEAIDVFGTPSRRSAISPVLRGELTVAEALTEPRGGSDFFGATTTARRDGDVYVLNGQKRFIVGAEGADYSWSTPGRDRTATRTRRSACSWSSAGRASRSSTSTA